MTQFTWRDVAAPDFSGAAKGFTEAGRLLQDTIGKASSGIEAFDKSQDTLAAEQLRTFIAKNQDPAALQAAFVAGNVGGMDTVGNKRFARAALDQLNPDAISAMVEAQRARANSQTAFDQKTKMDGLSDERQAIDVALANGHVKRAEEIRAGIDATGLGWDNVGVIGSSLIKARNSQTGADSSAFDFSKTVDDHLTNKAVIQYVEQIRGSEDPSGYELALNSLDVSPEVRAGVRRSLGIGSDAAPGSSAGFGGSGAAGGAGGGYGTIVGGVVSPPRPIETMTIAELEEFGNKVVIPATRDMDPAKRAQLGLTGNLGSSAMGRYQIIGDTAISYAKKLGLDPSTTVYSPAVQERLAEAIYNDAKGGDLTKVFASVPKRPAGFYAGKSWAEMRDSIAAGESGGSAAALMIQTAAANQDVKSTSQLNNAGSLAEAFDKSWNDGRSESQVAQDLLDKEGFKGKGVDQGLLIGKLGQIQARALKAGYEIRPAVAAEILKRSLQEENALERFALGEDIGNGRKMNWRQVDSYINQLQTGQIKTAATANEVLAQTESGFGVAKQNYEAAKQRLTTVTAAAKSKPNFNPASIARAQEEFNSATAAYAIAAESRDAGISAPVRATNPTVARQSSAPAAVAAPVKKGPETRYVTVNIGRGLTERVREVKSPRGVWIKG